jgi:hypothetical protein
VQSSIIEEEKGNRITTMKGFKEFFDDFMQGKQPEADAMHYTPIEAVNLDILDGCAVVCTQDFGEYTEMIFQAPDHITYFSLRIYCKQDFRIAKWIVDGENRRYLFDCNNNGGEEGGR